jgi:membrane-associated phospholipid phosphatase
MQQRSDRMRPTNGRDGRDGRDGREPGHEELSGLGRFEGRAALGWLAVVVGAAPFLALWLLVEREWAPLALIDGDVAAWLNAAVSGSPPTVSVLRAVTALGGTGTAVLVFGLITVFLLIRRQQRLAAFAATTGLGLAVLGPVTKAIVDRARPVVDVPVVDTPSNASFPSGHSMTALVTCGVLLVLLLPAVPRRARPWLVAGTALLVVAVGFTRLALGVHFVSDVLAGWALGGAWLAVTVGSFRAWQHRSGVHPVEPLDPLEVDPADAPLPAPAGGRVLPAGRTTAMRLVLAAAAVWIAWSALGLLVTGALGDTWVGRADRAVVEWLVGLRSDALTTVMKGVGTLSGTTAIIALSLSLAVVALAVTASWRPVVFVLVTIVGEVLLYFVVGQVVGRLRPDVADLTDGLPTGASWPSGHAAAAAALYGALAVLVVSLSRSRWRWAVVGIPLLIAPSIAISRIYVAAHFPSDAVAGLVLGGLWVLVCARALAPLGGDPVRAG